MLEVLMKKSWQWRYSSRRKGNRDVRQENDEDGGGDSPVISPNVWKYDAGGDVHQGNDDDDGDDDYGDQDVSGGEDDNFIGVNDCDSSPNQSCDDADVATEAEQGAADDSPSEAAQAKNAGNGKQSNVRRRGPRGLKWKKEIEKSSERLKVELPAKLGRVVGSNARQFVVEASWLLKQTLPPNVVKWKDLNPNDVAKLLEKVKNRFVFPDESHVDPALLWQFKQWYKAWRSDLRRVYFNKYETYEEQLANRPPYVKEDQWKWLVDYWSSEKFRNLSAINSKVRNSHTTIACVRPTSIPRLASELEMNQSQPDSDQSAVYLKLFEKQKRRIDGTWVDKEAEDGYNKLLKLYKKQVEDNGIDNLSPSEAYAKVFSRAKSINLIGLGENPIALGGSSSKRKRIGCSDQRIIEVLRASVETQSEQKSDDEEAQIEQTQSDRQLRAKMHEQIRSIREGLASSSTNPRIEHNVSHEEKVASGDIHQGEKENRDVHQEDDEDGGGDSPVIPPNVWKYVNAIGMSKTDCDSSPNQSCDDADFVATEAEQVAADGHSSEATPAANSGDRNQSNVHCRGPCGLKRKKEMEKSSERVKVELPAKVGQVVGSNARQFVVEASWLLKQTLPPNVVKWKDHNPNDVAKLLERP